jgi:hypothetical protein
MSANPSGPNAELDHFLSWLSQQININTVGWWRIVPYEHNSNQVVFAVTREDGSWATMLLEPQNLLKLSASFSIWANLLMQRQGATKEQAASVCLEMSRDFYNEIIQEMFGAHREAQS